MGPVDSPHGPDAGGAMGTRQDVVVDESKLAIDGEGEAVAAPDEMAAAPDAELASGTLLVTGHRLHWWRELLVTGLLYIFYESTRNLTKSGAGIAFFHAEQIMDWQTGPRHQRRALHPAVLHRPALAADHRPTTSTARRTCSPRSARSSGSTDKRPDYYPFWRNTLAVGTLIGLIGFRFYPLMPPRLLDVHLGQAVYGFVDTLQGVPDALVVQQLGHGEGVQPVRGHAEPALRLGDVGDGRPPSGSCGRGS